MFAAVEYKNEHGSLNGKQSHFEQMQTICGQFGFFPKFSTLMSNIYGIESPYRVCLIANRIEILLFLF